MSNLHKLDLLTNSISYFREAVQYAQNDFPNTNHWKFAIIHVVQAMELAFKEYLRRVHPAFVYESVDKPEKTLSLKGALARIRSPLIGALAITEGERAKIEKAIDLRNALTHFEFQYEKDQTEIKFAEIFGFMIFFYRERLNIKLSDIIEEEHHQNILKLVKARVEMLSRAKAYIKRLDIGDIWMCHACLEDTFVVSEAQCCFCHHAEKVVECESCGQEIVESDIIDTEDLFEWDHSEGRTILVEDYGLSHSACRLCIADIRKRAEESKRAQYDEDLLRDLLS
jgi:hypothetical protein